MSASSATRTRPPPDNEAAQTMSAEERAVALQFKPLWQRALVVAAGPFANFVLAIAVFTALALSLGTRVFGPVIGTVMPGTPAQLAGIKSGDAIRDIDGTKITLFRQIPEIIQIGGIQEHAVTLSRGGQDFTVRLTPRIDQQEVYGSHYRCRSWASNRRSKVILSSGTMVRSRLWARGSG